MIKIKAKQISNFPNYAITKDGRILSMPRYGIGRFAKWLKGWDVGDGHLCVGLTKNGKVYKRYIHRLVLETYVDKCPKGMECCHNDGNTTNNHLNNLRWDTRKSNIRDAMKHGTHKHFQSAEKHRMAKLTKKQVKLIFNTWHDGAYEAKELAEYFNVSTVTIYNIIHKKSWQSIWD